MSWRLIGRDRGANALDRNRDGVIDANELRDATELLQQLDRNRDGKLSREEVTGRRGGGKGGGKAKGKGPR